MMLGDSLMRLQMPCEVTRPESRLERKEVFDAFSQGLFAHLPPLEGLTPEVARRMLSRAYVAVIELRTAGGVSAEATAATDYVRRLASTIEFHAVLNDSVERDVRRAGAFVAAESVSLLADFHRYSELSERGCRLRQSRFYSRIEDAILYLIA